MKRICMAIIIVSVMMVSVIYTQTVNKSENQTEKYQKVFDDVINKARGHVFVISTWYIQKVATESLDNNAVPFMLEKAQKKPDKNWDENYRSVAIVFLGALKDSRAVEPLIKILKDEGGDREVYRHTAWALGEIGDKSATDQLIETMKTNKYEIVQSFANEALGKIWGEKDVITLVDVFNKGWVGAALSLGKLKDPRGIELLAKAVGTYDKEIYNWYIARGLAIANTPLSLDRLSSVIFDDKRPINIRTITLKAVADGPTSESMDILLKAVNDKEPGIRANAIRGLGNSGNRGLALPILINLAKSDPDIKVRMESLNVINTLGDPSVLKDLQEITTKDESLRSTLDRIIKRFTKLIEKEKAKQEQEQKKQDEPKNK